MTFKEIQDEVFVCVKDSSLESRIPGIVNDVLQEVVNEVHIPALKTLTTVGTVVGQSYTNLPDRMTGRLLFVGTETGKLAQADGGLSELLEDDPTMSTTGDLSKVALEGTVLWYISQPLVVTNIVLLIYKEPLSLVADGETASCLPSYIHRDLLVYGAAKVLWNIIEEGIDGEKVNTAVYEGFYQKGLDKLRAWVGKQTNHLSRSVWDK
jgi:hypothetical protein